MSKPKRIEIYKAIILQNIAIREALKHLQTGQGLDVGKAIQILKGVQE